MNKLVIPALLVCPFIRSFVHVLVCSFMRQFDRSCIRLFVRVFVRSVSSVVRLLVCSFVISVVRSCVRPLVLSFVCSFVCQFCRSFVRPSVSSVVRSLVRMFVRSFVRPLVLSFVRSFARKQVDLVANEFSSVSMFHSIRFFQIILVLKVGQWLTRRHRSRLTSSQNSRQTKYVFLFSHLKFEELMACSTFLLWLCFVYLCMQ